MHLLPVDRTMRFARSATNAGLSADEIGQISTLLAIAPFDGEQLSYAVPEIPADNFVGIYELGWPVYDPKNWIYYAHPGAGSVWLIRVTTSIRATDMIDGKSWLDAENAECRQLYLDHKHRP